MKRSFLKVHFKFVTMKVFAVMFGNKNVQLLNNKMTVVRNVEYWKRAPNWPTNKLNH